MSEHEFENYLKLLSGILNLSRKQQASIAGELRDHLEERLADLMAEGKTKTEAIALALEEFGDAAGLAHGFRQVVAEQKRKTVVRITSASMVTTAAAILLLWAMWPMDARVPVTLSTIAQVDAGKTDAATKPQSRRDPTDPLSQVLEINFDNSPLYTVAQYLSDISSLPVILSETALKDEGIDLDSPVTIAPQKVQLRTALSLLCRPHNMDWIVREDAIVLTTEEHASSQLITKVYDVSGLIATDQSATSPGATGLIDLVYEMVSPDSWQANGGTGKIDLLDNVLVVRQSSSIHDQVNALIQAMLQSVEPAMGQSLEARDVSMASDSMRRLREALDKPIAEVQLNSVLLRDVLTWMADTVGCPISLDPVAITDGSLSEDIEITLGLKNTTLRLIMSHLSDAHQLTWAFSDEAILITHRDRAVEYANVRLYPVSDLVIDNSGRIDWDRMDRLMTILIQNTSTDDYEYLDEGGVGSIRDMLGQAVFAIRQGDPVHEAIARVLSEMRITRARFGGPLPMKDAMVRKSYIRVDPSITSEELIAYLKECFPQAVWNEGSIRVLGQQLVIQQRPGIHRAIERACSDELARILAVGPEPNAPGGMGGGGMGGGMGGMGGGMGGGGMGGGGGRVGGMF